MYVLQPNKPPLLAMLRTLRLFEPRHRTCDWYIATEPLLNSKEYFKGVIWRHVLFSATAHYHFVGRYTGKNPTIWFNTEYYLRSNPDLVKSRVNPLAHFALYGQKEGRLPSRPESVISDLLYLSNVDDFQRNIINSSIDEQYYQQQLAKLGLSWPDDIGRHYLETGAACGLDPTPWFSTGSYWWAHADVRAAAVNPFYHYLVAGRHEGRALEHVSEANEMLPFVKAAAEDEQPAHRSDARMVSDLVKDAFDERYYLEVYEDIKNAGVDPFEHFMSAGWRERRNPNRWFNTSDYFDLNPDILECDINPLHHYLMHGRSEGRSPRLDFGFRYHMLKFPRTLEERLEEVPPVNPPAIDPAWQNSWRFRTMKRMHLTISHDDYAVNHGGVQLCIAIESQAVRAQSIDHVHVFPLQPLPSVRSDEDYLLGIRINDEPPFFLTQTKSVSFFDELSDARQQLASIAVHSLLGHHLAVIDQIISKFASAGCFFWIHDYASVCTNYNLMRNDVEFCGAPHERSLSCRICTCGTSRQHQSAGHLQLINKYRMTVVSPSQAAASLWSKAVGYEDDVIVHPHCVAMLDAAAPSGKVVSTAPIKVAFLGMPTGHKGWFAFRELALEFMDDERYQFLHFGKHQDPSAPVMFHHVAVTGDDRDAMINAIREQAIDVVCLWSLWPETFCFTAMESVAAGAFIVTNCNSGNVVDIVKEFGGEILNSEVELRDFFSSGELVSRISERTKPSYSLRYSEMTRELIQEIDHENCSPRFNCEVQLPVTC